jgi:transcriptional regulator of aromatic amino acid metabolism
MADMVLRKSYRLERLHEDGLTGLIVWLRRGGIDNIRRTGGAYGGHMQFEGTEAYVADKDLTVAVNAAIRLERPLLVKGEPGTGKTELARQVVRFAGHAD